MRRLNLLEAILRDISLIVYRYLHKSLVTQLNKQFHDIVGLDPYGKDGSTIAYGALSEPVKQYNRINDREYNVAEQRFNQSRLDDVNLIRHYTLGDNNYARFVLTSIRVPSKY